MNITVLHKMDRTPKTTTLDTLFTELLSTSVGGDTDIQHQEEALHRIVMTYGDQALAAVSADYKKEVIEGLGYDILGEGGERKPPAPPVALLLSDGNERPRAIEMKEAFFYELLSCMSQAKETRSPTLESSFWDLIDAHSDALDIFTADYMKQVISASKTILRETVMSTARPGLLQPITIKKRGAKRAEKTTLQKAFMETLQESLAKGGILANEHSALFLFIEEHPNFVFRLHEDYKKEVITMWGHDILSD